MKKWWLTNFMIQKYHEIRVEPSGSDSDLSRYILHWQSHTCSLKHRLKTLSRVKDHTPVTKWYKICKIGWEVSAIKFLKISHTHTPGHYYLSCTIQQVSGNTAFKMNKFWKQWSDTVAVPQWVCQQVISVTSAIVERQGACFQTIGSISEVL